MEKKRQISKLAWPAIFVVYKNKAIIKSRSYTKARLIRQRETNHTKIKKEDLILILFYNLKFLYFLFLSYLSVTSKRVASSPFFIV